MTFVHPAILLLLWLAPIPPALLVVLRRRQLRRAARISPAAGRRPSGVFYAQCALIALGLALAVVAGARPQWGRREQVVAGSGRNVMLLLDVSRSMLARDVRPNRLERAKADLIDLISELDGDRAGLTAFRNGARMLCPFTTDTTFLLQALDGVSIDSAPRGETDIGAAITSALAAFNALGSDHNAIVLVSDGGDLSGTALEKAKEAALRRIPIFCVGIGDSVGSAIPDGDDGSAMKYRGEEVLTKLENETLAEIAKVSGGAYIPLQTAATGRNTLGKIYNNHVRAVVEGELREMSETLAIERFQLFLIPALAMILLAAALSAGRPPARKRTAKE